MREAVVMKLQAAEPERGWSILPAPRVNVAGATWVLVVVRHFDFGSVGCTASGSARLAVLATGNLHGGQTELYGCREPQVIFSHVLPKQDVAEESPLWLTSKST